jgi:hypothetical protein
MIPGASVMAGRTLCSPTGLGGGSEDSVATYRFCPSSGGGRGCSQLLGKEFCESPDGCVTALTEWSWGSLFWLGLTKVLRSVASSVGRAGGGQGNRRIAPAEMEPSPLCVRARATVRNSGELNVGRNGRQLLR